MEKHTEKNKARHGRDIDEKVYWVGNGRALALLGARVLEILRDEIDMRARLVSGTVESQVRAYYEERAQGIDRISEAARKLGLLGEEKTK